MGGTAHVKTPKKKGIPCSVSYTLGERWRFGCTWIRERRLQWGGELLEDCCGFFLSGQHHQVAADWVTVCMEEHIKSWRVLPMGVFGIKTLEKRKEGQSYMSLCSEHRLAKLNDPDWPGRLLHFSSSSTGPGNQNDAAQVVWRRMPMSARRHFCCGVGWCPSRFSSRQSMHCRPPYYGSLQPVYNFCLQPF